MLLGSDIYPFQGFSPLLPCIKMKGEVKEPTHLWYCKGLRHGVPSVVVWLTIITYVISNVQLSYVSLTSLHRYEYITNSQSEQLPVGLINVAQLVNGRALHWYCRDHGLESWLRLNCFHGFFSQLLKMHSRLNGLSFIHSFVCDSHLCVWYISLLFILSYWDSYRWTCTCRFKIILL